MMALAGVELEMLVSEPDALTTRPQLIRLVNIWNKSLTTQQLYLDYTSQPNYAIILALCVIKTCLFTIALKQKSCSQNQFK